MFFKDLILDITVMEYEIHIIIQIVRRKTNLSKISHEKK